ncbi:ATP:corrinoid adenosyltransferase [Methanococcus voltae]|uniref:ATP:corrinoid adenosyltransferase n=2 Tax=Methanococcus voltae TaxID=2188 RepID=A0A8J7RHN6_METVO|nr:hypothetical protein [Methanococcus voltae]MBP2201086.1 ATP:corrinoid adenosyltransferase [Methanococcus voltae]MCS3921809.1 ATP:corrinoid adenosyltransferase [Methanococcus voltae PS]
MPVYINGKSSSVPLFLKIIFWIGLLLLIPFIIAGIFVLFGYFTIKWIYKKLTKVDRKLKTKKIKIYESEEEFNNSKSSNSFFGEFKDFINSLNLKRFLNPFGNSKSAKIDENENMDEYVSFEEFNGSNNTNNKNTEKDTVTPIKIEKFETDDSIEINISNVDNNDDNNRLDADKDIDVENTENKEAIKFDNLDYKKFVEYLKSNGLIEKNGALYLFDKSVYAVYQDSYPVNDLVSIYEEKPETDIVILGLKGKPSEPKKIYNIPTKITENKIKLEDLEEFEIKL